MEPISASTSPGKRITTWLITLANIYLGGLWSWACLYAFAGDRWWWSFTLNALSIYFFLPLPAVLGVALLARRRSVWVSTAAAAVLWAYLFGGLFMPRLSPAPDKQASLAVTTYNLNGGNANRAGILATIRAAEADVVALQELNPTVAQILRSELAGEYPYQVLDPRDGVYGMGAISRYPMYPTGQSLPGDWVGAPQVLAISWPAAPVTLVNFHAVPPGLPLPPTPYLVELAEWTVRERERQAQTLVDFAAAQPGPLIAAGDFNAAGPNTAYAVVTRRLKDAWRQAGWGLGHTYAFGALPFPRWQLRIDYVFYSKHWQAGAAQVGVWDGVSDHKPVVARLILRNDAD